jgi:predicted CoA-substrate-specific enzyme activase
MLEVSVQHEWLLDPSVIRHAPDRVFERLRAAGAVTVGIDVGSTSSDVVVLNGQGGILYCDYRRTKGRPIETVRTQLAVVIEQLSADRVSLAAATGTVGRFIAKLLAIPFVNEVAAQAAAVQRLYPHLKQATVIEMGGQDSKLIFLCEENGQVGVKEFAINTVCAAGTGSFLDQQAQRLGINIECEFGELALQSTSVPRMAGRCSVFAKSDMIHLQQQATPVCDILAGLCLALARNLKSNLGGGRQFVKPIVFTGGVAANGGVVRALKQVFRLSPEELLVPKQHFFTGALGAVLLAKTRRRGSASDGRLDIAKLDDYLAQRGVGLKAAPRRDRLSKPTLPPPSSPVYEDLLATAGEPLDAYIGVDVGSLSTNVAVIDSQQRILAKAYLMTAGRPLEAVREGLDEVGRKVVGKVRIRGAATTGSGRYLTGDFIGADVVINEITAQAAGAAIVNPSVDTIFEIGGQDSKYISLANGVVVDFEMNHACAAGTGSFLEEQAQRLDINIDKEFAACAFKSDDPIKLGERCTVFMESDLLSYQQQGARTEDLVAGLSYSIVANYLNRVVGRRKIGSNICFQGGTAFNHAVWAAFEKVTGKPILVPDHHEVTGALGAAAIAADYMSKRAQEQGGAVESKFRGFENLVSLDYSVESFTCEHCPNHCEIKKVQLPDAEPLYYGSRCDRYDLKKKSKARADLGAFEYRHRWLMECAGLDDKSERQPGVRGTVGIPMALIYWQLLPLFARFFKRLGYEVILSGRTDKRIIRRGVECVNAQPCFPVKVAYGHIADLIGKEVDYIFLPSIVSMTASFPQNQHNQLCPYVQSIGYQAGTAFAQTPGGAKILTAPLRLGEGSKLADKSFVSLGRMLGVSASQVRRALKEAFAAQGRFEKELKKEGKEILDAIRPGEKLFVLVSRPYNGCDDGLNLQLPRKLAELGVKIIPMEMLSLEKAELTDEVLHSQVYWSYGQKILRAAEIIRSDPRLFAIYLSNFSCGPDSFIMTFFKDIMGDKPCLQLEIDEHSADAGVITRLEAFLESLKNYRPSGEAEPPAKKCATAAALGSERTLYIPYMGDCAYGVAAAMRAGGQPAEVMPIADEAALLQGRAYTTGKECLPCAITTGDMLTVIRAHGAERHKLAFFMPSASGPCRFGMYSCLHRLVQKYAGAEDIPVIAPNQEGGFYKELGVTAGRSSSGRFLKDVWTAVVGIDLLYKLLLRIRPYAMDPAHAQRIYEKLRGQWEHAAESRFTLEQMRDLMRAIADYFDAIELDTARQKPRIGIVGEIYVRSHPFANLNLISRLEQLGAACDLASLAEWIYYTNLTRSRMSRRRGQWRNYLTNALQNHFQRRIERILAEPLEKEFGPLAEGPVEHVLELARPYLHDSFEGEAVLSIGKMVEYHHQGFGGVVNVMPFTCMPSTIVSTQTQRISADCGGMPILNLSFDGQEDPTLTTRLEAFVEQVASRQQGGVTCAAVMAASG